MKNPLLYYGGKWRMAQTILQYFPPHNTYIEVFGGAASILLQKAPSELEIFNDLNQHIVNYFQVLRDRPEDLLAKLRLTPYSRAEARDCRTPHEDPVEDARRFFVSCWQSISHAPFEASSGFSTPTFAGQKYYGDTLLQFRTAMRTLESVTERLLQVYLECRPFAYILSRYDTPEALFYCDPPYMPPTRASKKVYQCEMTEEEHSQLATLLHEVKGLVILSGYDHPLYHTWYDGEGWERVEFKSQTNGGDRTECLWLSPRTVEALHRPKQLSLL